MTSLDRDGCVTFRFYRPGVKEVKVLGTFNGWSGDSLTMSAAGNGWWTVTAELPAGEYRFKYWIDNDTEAGEWFSDFAANGVEFGRYGWNSILVVPQRVEDSLMEDEMPIRQAA